MNQQSEHINRPALSFPGDWPDIFLRRHPHSAITRKALPGGVRVQVHTVGGKLSAVVSGDGEYSQHFVKTPRDAAKLLNYLRDVEYLPNPAAQVAPVAYLGMWPQYELRRVWSGEGYQRLVDWPGEPLEACAAQMRRLLRRRADICREMGIANLVLTCDEPIPPAQADRLHSRSGAALWLRGLPQCGCPPGAVALVPYHHKGWDTTRYMAEVDARREDVAALARGLGGDTACVGLVVLHSAQNPAGAQGALAAFSGQAN